MSHCLFSIHQHFLRYTSLFPSFCFLTTSPAPPTPCLIPPSENMVFDDRGNLALCDLGSVGVGRLKCWLASENFTVMLNCRNVKDLSEGVKPVGPLARMSIRLLLALFLNYFILLTLRTALPRVLPHHFPKFCRVQSWSPSEFQLWAWVRKDMSNVKRAIQKECDDYFALENIIISMLFCCLHRHDNTPGPRGAWQGVQLKVVFGQLKHQLQLLPCTKTCKPACKKKTLSLL